MSAPSSINKIVLQNAPSTVVDLSWGQAESTFKMESEALTAESVAAGHVLVKLLYLSNDPTQRSWMQKDLVADRMYAPPIREGESIRSFGIGQVVESKSDKWAVGDKVVGIFLWQDYAVVPETSIWNKIDESKGLPLEMYLGSVGATGLTAYFGLTEVGQFKAGQTVLVSAASGATGSMVVQIAKLLGAKKVIGITGSDEKCKWVESLGADFTVNYHDKDYQEKLTEYIGKDYVDVYFDNVGGEILSYALKKVKAWGHVVACGAVSGYNDSSKYAVTSWTEIITNRLNVRGFIVSDFAAKFGEGVAAIVGGIQAGKIQLAGGTHVVDLSGEKEPLSKVPENWNKLFTKEKPNGKLVTKLA